MNEEQNINQLPKDWAQKKLYEVGKVINGDRGRNYPSRAHYVSSGVPFISAGNIDKNFVDVNNLNYITEEKYRLLNSGKLINGDIIYCLRGSLGKCAIFTLEKGAISSSLCILRLNNDVITKYVYYYLCSPLSTNEIRKHDNGTAQPNLSAKNFSSYLIPKPSIKAQLTIVSKIEELFSELDKGIENLRTAQQQLKTYRQSVLKWAFEGKLTNENVKEGELPKGWKNTSIEEVATVGTGATPLKSKSEYYGGNIAWVTSGALNDEYVREATDFVTEKAVKETNLSVYPKHTLLVAMYGEGKTRGKCSELLIEACTNQAIAAIYFNEHQIAVKPYLKYFLLKNYTDVRKKSSGGVQPNLNLSIIKRLQFPLAPIEEQSRIIQEIESRLSVADKMEESITKSLQQAEALRQSILKKAFEGRLI